MKFRTMNCIKEPCEDVLSNGLVKELKNIEDSKEFIDAPPLPEHLYKIPKRVQENLENKRDGKI